MAITLSFQPSTKKKKKSAFRDADYRHFEQQKIPGIDDREYRWQEMAQRLWPFIAPYKFRFFLALIITIPIGLLDGAIAYVLKPYIDGIAGDAGFVEVAYIPFFIVAFTLIQGLLNFVSVYLNGWLGYKLMNNIREALFEKLQQLDVGLVERMSSGWLVARFFRDPEQLQSSLLNNTKTLLTRLFSTIGLCAVLLSHSGKLALIAIGALGLTLFPATLIRRTVKRVSQRMAQTTGDLITFYNESFMGAMVIRGFGMEKQREEAYRDIQGRMFRQYIAQVKTQGLLTPTMHIIAATGIAIVLWQGTAMVVSGEITTGTFASFLAALVMLYNPLKSVSGTLMNSQLAFQATSRIFAIMDAPLHIHETDDVRPLNRIREGIRLSHVTFGYDPKKPVLHNVSLEIPVGSTVALVGRSGSGKSTIANLIPRFYDVQQGEVTIDGIPVQDYTLKTLRARVALVTQDNFLFEGTIRENLLVGKATATDEDMWDALRKAQLEDFVRSSADGLDTLIGERGTLVSGGQKQRIAIARAILKDAPIVILDEATSALDTEAERRIQSALDALMEHRTVIIIAHRLSSIRRAERIMVMENGCIVESGSHAELMASNGAYRTLYDLQHTGTVENSLEEEPHSAQSSREGQVSVTADHVSTLPSG